MKLECCIHIAEVAGSTPASTMTALGGGSVKAHRFNSYQTHGEKVRGKSHFAYGRNINNEGD